MYKKMLLIFFIGNIWLSDLHAENMNAGHILSIGDDGDLSYRYMFTDSVGASVGFYLADRKRSNNIGQSYTRNYQSQTIALRLIVNPDNILRKFIEFSIMHGRATYVGSTAENYDSTDEFIFFGVEYLLSDYFSVEGMFGIGVYETTYETENESGRFGPTTRLAVSYLF